MFSSLCYFFLDCSFQFFKFHSIITSCKWLDIISKIDFLSLLSSSYLSLCCWFLYNTYHLLHFLIYLLTYLLPIAFPSPKICSVEHRLFKGKDILPFCFLLYLELLIYGVWQYHKCSKYLFDELVRNLEICFSMWITEWNFGPEKDKPYLCKVIF